MKFYDSIGPNPRLVRMFAAEKGFSFPQVEKVDLMAGANRKEPYLSKNPAGQVPALELDDGLVICETVAICEYLEELKPKPALIGSDAEQRAETRMWIRRVEWKMTQPLADGFRFGEGIQLFKNRIRTLPEASAGLKAIAKDGLGWLDQQMEGRDTIVPKRFTLADIVLFAFLDFGATVARGSTPPTRTSRSGSRAGRRGPARRPSPQFSPGLCCNAVSDRSAALRPLGLLDVPPGTPARASVARLASAAISGVSRRHRVRNAG